MMEATQSLNRLVLIIGNLVAYLAVVILSIIYSTGNLHEHPSYISEQHPNKFMPSSWTYILWIAIFILTGIFVLYQAIPSRRDSYYIHAAIGPLFIFNYISLFIWIFTYSFNSMWGSFVFMLIALVTMGILYSRVSIDYSVVGRARTDRLGNPLTIADFWILQVPFSLSLGWLAFLTIVNFTMALSDHTQSFGWSGDAWSVAWQIILSIVGLAVLRIRYDPFFSFAITWGLFGIADNYRFDTLLCTSSLVCGILLGIATISSLGHLFFHHYYRERYLSIHH